MTRYVKNLGEYERDQEPSHGGGILSVLFCSELVSTKKIDSRGAPFVGVF